VVSCPSVVPAATISVRSAEAKAGWAIAGRIAKGVQVTLELPVVTVSLRLVVLVLLTTKALVHVLLAGMVAGVRSDMTLLVSLGYVILGAPVVWEGGVKEAVLVKFSCTGPP
jgi:hypothetical protein